MKQRLLNGASTQKEDFNLLLAKYAHRLRGDDVWEWHYRVRGKMKQEKFKVADYPTEKALWKHLATSVRLPSMKGRSSRSRLRSTCGVPGLFCTS